MPSTWTSMAPLLKATPLNNVPGSGLLFTLLGIGFDLLFAWIFFEAIYIVVPNQHISFRNSWMGAVVAAVAKVYPYIGACRDRTGFRHRVLRQRTAK